MLTILNLLGWRLLIPGKSKNQLERLGRPFRGMGILSEIRALQNVVRNRQIDGLDQMALAALDAKICELTTDQVGVGLSDSDT